jgi:chromosome partitioning protein
MNLAHFTFTAGWVKIASFDVWTLEKAAHLIEELRLANPALLAYAFLNRTDPRGQDNLEAAAVLQDTPALHFLDTPLGARKAFSNAAAQGLAVPELTPSDAKATAEILALFHYLFDSTLTTKR